MERASSSLAAVAAPLFAAFGDALSVTRAGTAVRWAFAGQAAVVDLREDGSLDARFLAMPTADVASGTTATGVYRPDGRGYALTPTDCDRMVADTIAFFSGAREPRFVFIDVL